jgi:excisionase family DNA binding protein
MEVIALRRAAAPVDPPQLLRPREAAARLSISERTFWRYIRKGLLPHVRLGEDQRTVRVPVAALDEYIRSRTVRSSA